MKGATQYAHSLGLDVGDDIVLPLGAMSAENQLQTAGRNGVDYLVVHSNASAMRTLLEERQDVHPGVTVCGLTWTVDEIRVQQPPTVFEGGDRRATTTGRLYEVTDGELVQQE